MNQSSFTIAADDPCLDGHFAGNPLVPAVVILDAVIECAQARSNVDIAGISRCKFLRPLRPGEACDIALSPVNGQRMRFSCQTSAGEVAQGWLALQ